MSLVLDKGWMMIYIKTRYKFVENLSKCEVNIYPKLMTFIAVWAKEGEK